MNVAKTQLKSIDLFTQHAPELVHCLAICLRECGVVEVNENHLYNAFRASFALKRRLKIRAQKHMEVTESSPIVSRKRASPEPQTESVELKRRALATGGNLV